MENFLYYFKLNQGGLLVKNKQYFFGVSILLVAAFINSPPTFSQRMNTEPQNNNSNLTQNNFKSPSINQNSPTDNPENPDNQMPSSASQNTDANTTSTNTNDTSTTTSSDNSTTPSASPLQIQTALFAYPIITMDTTRKVMTNVPSAGSTAAPMGQFANMTKFLDASFTNVTAPNADTLYSIAWLDLSTEPYILHLPNENGRYFVMPLLDAWTNVFASLGTRTTGTTEQNFAIVGPHWNGKLPNNMKEIKAPTNMVWIIGRTFCSGTPEDIKAVNAIQSQYSLTPLSAYGTDYTPPSNLATDSNIDMKIPPREQVNNMDASTYYNELNMLLQSNPPSEKDAKLMAVVAKIGVVPGQKFDLNKLNPTIATGMEESIKDAVQTIEANLSTYSVNENGWQFLKTGVYGSNYLRRAVITFVGLGANLPQDAMYPMTGVDNDDQQLNGSNKYIIHFNKGELPPVKGFWSLTMYNDKYYFVNNSLNRYRLNSSDKLIHNKDGSTDIYIQNQSPGADKQANWLPAPNGNFNLCFRFYWPDQSIISGEWKPPAVRKVS